MTINLFEDVGKAMAIVLGYYGFKLVFIFYIIITPYEFNV